MTESMIDKFQRAEETTWQVRYGYDFMTVGVPGFSFLGMYEVARISARPRATKKIGSAI